MLRLCPCGLGPESFALSVSFQPAKPIRGRSGNMTRTRVRIDPGQRRDLPAGRVNYEVLDATTERDIAAQQRQDEAEAMRDMAHFARRVRKRLGLTQHEFARRIDVPQDTIRNWEQGKRAPPVQPRRCSACSTRHPRQRCSCCAETVPRAARVEPTPSAASARGPRPLSATLSACRGARQARWRRDAEAPQEPRDEVATVGRLLSCDLGSPGEGTGSAGAVARVSVRRSIDANVVIA